MRIFVWVLCVYVCARMLYICVWVGVRVHILCVHVCVCVVRACVCVWSFFLFRFSGFLLCFIKQYFPDEHPNPS
eukprot:m.28630 g.28630  ORF g.28630 m.28630 type:complete len:74 (-) comp15948_c0_seq1:217-438(-)